MNRSRRVEVTVKVSGEKVAAHRAALLATAKRLLQERGFQGAAVAEISRAAGLTEGALYGQFGSKDALAAAAIRAACAEASQGWEGLLTSSPDALSAFLEAYLSEEHAYAPGAACTLAACVSEIGRQDRAIVAAYADGFRKLTGLIERALAEPSPEAARRRALALLSGMVGAVALARALAKEDPDLAHDILSAAHEEFERLIVHDAPH